MNAKKEISGGQGGASKDSRVNKHENSRTSVTKELAAQLNLAIYKGLAPLRSQSLQTEECDDLTAQGTERACDFLLKEVDDG